MKYSFAQKLNKLSLFPIFLLCFISTIGFGILYSAADGYLMPWAGKQMIRFIFGLCLMLFIAVVDIRTWMFLAYPFYLVSLLLLIGVEVTGFIGMGAQRWIDLYILQLQPSELMKIALIMALARYFHLTSLEEIRKPARLIFPILLILLPTLLVLRQPDLGTAMILILSGTVLFFLTGVKVWKFIAIGGIVGASFPLLWSMLHDYQKKRILVFLNPESDPSHAGYHVSQSKIALGSGGWFGKGYMKGSQSHLNFLPEKQTDFIFTMLSEEFGFIGGIILVFLYSCLLIYGFFVSLRARSHFGQLISMGMNAILFLYVFINMAMVMGMLPVVGVPLPLISYGGTALLTLLMGQGILLAVSLSRDIRIRR